MRKNSVTMKEAIEQMVTDLKLKPKLNESRIKENWRRIMGEMIANHTSGVSLNRGTLYLRVDSAALKHELTYSKEKIKELFNRELDEPAIHEVHIY